MNKFDNPFHDVNWKKKAMTSEIIPMFSGRPDRGVITQDDINNLSIALNTTSTVTDFIKVIA